MSRSFWLWPAQALFCLVCCSFVQAQQIPQVASLNVPTLWHRAEFRVNNVPAAANVFDPEVLQVDAVFRTPSGRTLTVPAFWYQGYQRSLSGANEILNAVGPAEWRVRFTPTEPGDYSVFVVVKPAVQSPLTSQPLSFVVSSNASASGSGYVRMAPSRQYLETGDGHALKLIGENVCWHGSRGTYDYDTWFPAMQSAGENFARLWMWPYAFGLEVETNSLTRYRLDRAWQLDYVVQSAEQRGIYLLLCLDYHGMFEVTPDTWGGNNFWPKNPYCVTNGGPCLNQNGFFTNTTARTVYQKRLRYLVARYGYSQNLLAWEFFNEIDNVYQYLQSADVANWHHVMGGWLRSNDPFQHLVTTSLTGSSDRPEMWVVPELDFAAYHSYNEPGPAGRLSVVAQSFLSRYRKPVMIGEFGLDWRGWNRANDPYLRGFRQGIWGGALGGSVGTGMSWYWESIHAENAYPAYAGLSAILKRTGWCSGSWTNIGFKTSGGPPPLVGNPLGGAPPFAALLVPGSGWGARPAGLLAVANADSAGYAASTLNSFVHGGAHADLRVPFRLNAWLTNNARLVLHLNSVSDGAVLTVRADGVELYRTNLPNLDGAWSVNNEYNLDLTVNLPAGKRSIDIVNAGSDWFYLDWVRLENVLPAHYSPDWQPSPASIGLAGRHESLLYVVAPGVSFPGNATNSSLPLQQGQTIVLTNWPSGRYLADWYDPLGGTNVAHTTGITTNGVLALPLPGFRDDLAGLVYPNPKLTSVSLDPTQGFGFQLESETAGEYLIEISSDLTNWAPFLQWTNTDGASWILAPVAGQGAFFRAKR